MQARAQLDCLAHCLGGIKGRLRSWQTLDEAGRHLEQELVEGGLSCPCEPGLIHLTRALCQSCLHTQAEVWSGSRPAP